ncbi:uncharacterized protein BJ171DRAFT_539662 [Polychytrium aggregatum]|uniref:uncharacterized protein n=1 Tax=Polychytrium aggregatum TaxID=110093 RepID=UPI0022FE9575|nr:uncharacterized protein BJ171DRAFT_539662 [Polychytrium aggregatum]KAI9190818.1 hypothetical protein BJ171DRAFT_539662 [Polychytrium aggregatum]
MIADYEHKFPNYTARHGVIILNSVLLALAIWKLISFFIYIPVGAYFIVGVILAIISVLLYGYGQFGLMTNNLRAIKSLSIWYFVVTVLLFIVAIISLNAGYIIDGLLSVLLNVFYSLHLHAYYKSLANGVALV